MIKNQNGFSLIEVMVALVIFSVIALPMIFTQSANIQSSINMNSDLTLHNLAEMKMNEVLVGPKEFTNATENDVDGGNFEIDGYQEFKYEVRITKIEFPNFSELIGKTEEEGQDDNAQDSIQKLIFEKMKKNIEEIIWQVNVIVTNPGTGDTYELNSWINKSNAKIDTNFSF